MGRMSRNKGKSGELEFAHELTWYLNCEACRGRQYHGRQDAPDVHTDLNGIHFEVKRTEALSLYTAMAQATEDAGDAIPVVAHRRNDHEWLLVVKLTDLPEFIRRLADNVK